MWDMAYTRMNIKPGVQQHEEDFCCLKLIFTSPGHAYLLMLRCLNKLVQTYERIGIVTHSPSPRKRSDPDFSALFKNTRHETIKIIQYLTKASIMLGAFARSGCFRKSLIIQYDPTGFLILSDVSSLFMATFPSLT